MPGMRIRGRDPNGERPRVSEQAVERLLASARRRADGFQGLSPRRVSRMLGLGHVRPHRRAGTYVAGGADASTAAGIRIKRREILILTPDVETVRIHLDPRVTTGFLEDVARLQAFIPGPPLSIVAPCHATRSPWQHGMRLDTVDAATRIAAVRALLSAQTDAVRATRAEDPSDVVRTALDVGRVAGGPEAAALTALLEHPSTARLAGLPLALQHGDPWSGNVIVTPDGTAAMVDWTPSTVGRRPFWTDAAHLVSIDEHRPLREGAFDAELAALWRAAGLRTPDAEELRRLLPLAGVLFCVMISLSVDREGRVISLTTGAPPTRLSKPWKIQRALDHLPPSLRLS